MQLLPEVCVCVFPSRRVAPSTCLAEELRSEISDGYDDEAFWHILFFFSPYSEHRSSAREMEGGDPFRSLMSEVPGAPQSDMLEL